MNRIEVEGVKKIYRIADIFEIWPGDELPMAKFKVKVLERPGEQYLGVPNIAIRNPETGEPEWTGGLGDTVQAAVEDAIRYIFLEIKTNKYERQLTCDDFCWADPDDF